MFVKEYKDIKLSEIKSFDNSRGDAGDVHGLMRNIKHYGLLQPVGVVQNGYNAYKLCWGNRRVEACLKLQWNTIPTVILEKEMTELEFDTLNYIENEHRENLSNIDRGRYYYNLMKKYNMTISEVAACLNINENRVKDGLNAFKFTPNEFKNKIAPFMAGRESKKGLIPASYIKTLNTIINRYKLKKEQIEVLYEYARQDDVSTSSLDFVGLFLRMGYKLKEAISMMSKYRKCWFIVPIPKEEINEYLKEHNTTIKKLGMDMFRGDVKVKFNVPKWINEEEN